MQQNLVLIIWTIIGIIAVWFLAMAINRNIFLHTDADLSVYGSVAIINTDIGNQCGDEYINSTEQVEFKLTQTGKIVYLCPQGWSPLQKKVTAVTLTDEFRRSLRPNELDKVSIHYPLQVAAPPINPYIAAPQ
ncbi:MAG: hypothetical protein P4M14_01235 [Gammaproteobacteria bacterium]|nr:hypothetical protein [Gammaproteobacteria bacterium]